MHRCTCPLQLYFFLKCSYTFFLHKSILFIILRIKVLGEIIEKSILYEIFDILFQKKMSFKKNILSYNKWSNVPLYAFSDTFHYVFHNISRSFVSVDDLKERIKMHCSNVNNNQLKNVMINVMKRVRKCVEWNIWTLIVRKNNFFFK